MLRCWQPARSTWWSGNNPESFTSAGVVRAPGLPLRRRFSKWPVSRRCCWPPTSANTARPRGGPSIRRSPMPRWSAWAWSRCLRCAAPWNCISKAARRSMRLGLDGVVTFTRLRLVVLIRELDVDLAVRTVLGFVQRRIGDGVLAAHFVLQFFKHLLERVLPVHLVDVPPGLFGHLPEIAAAAPAAEHQAAPVGAGIVILDAVDHGVGLLRGLDRLFDGEAAPLVHAVGDDHDYFAAHLALQLLVRREVDRIV